jgi:hypothetical protein
MKQNKMGRKQGSPERTFKLMEEYTKDVICTNNSDISCE